MALQDEIAAQRSKTNTESYTMSIGELLNLYRDGEIDVHPEFQRVYRWTPYQKTRLIEDLAIQGAFRASVVQLPAEIPSN